MLRLAPGFTGGIFYLNSGLEIESGLDIRPQPFDPAAGTMRGYRLGPTASGEVHLRYRGSLRGTGGGLGASEISRAGVFLDGGGGWYPRFGDELVSFSLRVRLPAGWSAVSQGARIEGGDGITGWRERQPQDDIVLVAGRWQRTARSPDGAVATAAYLRQPDDALAARYLDAADEYLSLYSRLIGPYPYAKFAVVENFRETGFGFPSFTLLGSRVMRLPFLLASSFPHEVLHDWWGNGVYVDPAGGNWSEGLTAYLADHLLQERRGRGAAHRRAALQKYRNYVDRDNDFALSGFRSAHAGAGQAVGYNKALMMFHMLRRRLGDRRFVDGLRRFFREHRFTRAGFEDLRHAFEAAGGGALEGFFAQWVERIGAPALALAAVESERGDDGGYRLRARLRQTQSGQAYRLAVPVAVQVEGEDRGRVVTVFSDRRETSIELELPARPLRVVVDPGFDLFRRLDRAEIPPALGELLGAAGTVAVLPADAPPDLRRAYRAAARGLGAVAMFDDRSAGPSGGARWILGWSNRRQVDMQSGLAEQDAQLAVDGIRIAGGEHLARQECVVLATRDARGDALGFVGCDDPPTLAAVMRKLRHYGSFGYAAFEPGARNRVRGQWASTASPLDRRLVAGAPTPLRLPPRAALDAVQ